MANYDFQSLLSPLDFEHLVRDLLSKDLSIELTAFAEGRDSGIDIRYSKDNSNEVIVQCKRVKNLPNEKIEEEAEKVTKLNPKKYYLVVSHDISPAKHDYIKKLFENWMEGDSNIYTRNRLNNLLDEHPDIQHKNYKLWLNSATIFNSLINNPLYERAKSLINDIKRDYKYYVRGDSFNQAIELLNKNQFVIISGIPGIGKTTLAKLILWEYLQKGFEIIEIRKVTEGEQILVENSSNNQVFYFDDFLGENFLKFDVIEGRSNDLIQFIKRIKSSKNKILIMTTREYILNQAKDVYEKLNSPELDIAKHTLDLSSYSKKIKTQILYNHLFYSELPIEYIEEIIKAKAYKTIINHKNYSPRIIEKLTVQLKDTPIENYPKEFIKSLDAPFGIWDKAFNSQITEGARLTLYLLLSISNPILLSDLKKALDALYENNTKEKDFNFRPIDFRNYIKELENCFIKVNITDKKNHFIDFLNPSIKDFLLSIVKNDIELVKILLKSSIFFEQFKYTIRYLAENFIQDSTIQEIIDTQILNKFDNFEDHAKIYFSENEFSFSTIKDITKIDGLKFYLKLSSGKQVKNFMLRKFENISIGNLYSYEERKYLEFYSEYESELNLNFTNVMKQLIENIRWYDSVEHLPLLRGINNKDYDLYISSNKAYIGDKIKDSIKKEIEFRDKPDNLNELISSLKENSDLATYGISYSEFEDDFDNRLSELEETIIEKDLNISVESSPTLEIDNWEDELFKIEMFSR